MSSRLLTAVVITMTVAWLSSVTSVASVTSLSQSPPPRDRGTARIAGTVVDRADSPIAGAVITLCSATWKCQTAETDATGSFAFSALVEGVYLLRAERFGYFRTEYGALRPAGDGTPIALASNQRLTDVTLTMARTGSVSGTVRDVDGRPAAGIFVGLNRPDQPGEFGLEKTKADGTYRIDAVPAGDYYVVAGMMRRVESVPTFYPSAPSASQATTVKVKRGEERDHIDISLVHASPTFIRGVVLDPAGMPASDVGVTIIPHSGFVGVNGCTTDQDGALSCLGLSPGRYTLFATTKPIAPSGSSRPMPTIKSLDALEAREDVEVPVEGTSNLVVRLRRGILFSGRVVFDGARLPPPTNFEDVEIRLDRPGWMPYGAKVKTGGTFAWAGLPEVLTVSAAGPTGWRLRSAMWQGRDLLETGLDLNDATGDVTGVVLTFSDRRSSVSGVVKTDDGRPESGCTVVVFPTSPGPWPAFHPRVASQRPATNGRYEFRDLPPGDYYVATVRDLGEGDWRTPEFLRPHIAHATRVTLREGEQLNLALRSCKEITD